MCHCSVLIRAVMATLLSHWDSCRDKSARNAPWHVDATCRVIECLSKVREATETNELYLTVRSTVLYDVVMTFSGLYCRASKLTEK